ncbi:MAG: sulfatase [Acidobacteriota bacterium]
MLLLPLLGAAAAFYFSQGGTLVLLISLDTVRADRVGCYGYDRAQTQFIDQLAADGTVFRNAITAATFTPASHASIFTGLCPCKHGVRFPWRFRGQDLAPHVRTLAELFKAKGYETAAFISARPLQSKIHSLNRGFDLYDESYLSDKTRVGEAQHQRRADETVDAACDWIAARKSPNCFVFIHLFDAHDGEIDPPAEFEKQYRARVAEQKGGSTARSPRRLRREFDRYDCEVAWMDSEIRRMAGRVSSMRGRRDVYFVVLADHGEGLGEHDYKRHAERIYQEQLHVPLIWNGPRVAAGKVIDTFVRTVDVVPTLAELLGLDVPEGLDGASLVPLFHGRDAADRICYSETRHPLVNRGEALFSIIKNRRKLIYAPQSGRFEYYNLRKDPDESHDLAAAGGFDGLLAELKKHDLSTDAARKEDVDAEVEEGLAALGYVDEASSSSGKTNRDR